MDWVTITIYLFLVIFGWMNIYSSAYKGAEGFDITQRYSKQLLWIAVAVVIIISIFLVENHVYSTLAYIIYGASLLLLIAVLIFGVEVHDSRSWIAIGDFRLQPAEFAKFATALALAKFMNKENFKFRHNFSNFFNSVLIIVLPALFILLQGDTGSAMVYIVFVLVMYREGLSFIWILIIFLEVLVFISTFFFGISIIFAFILLLSFFVYAIFSGEYLKTVLVFSALLGVYIVFWTIEILTFIEIDNHIIFAASVFIFLTVSVFFAYKKRKYISLIISAIAFLLMISTYSTNYVFHELLKEHHRSRINVLLGLEEDLKGVGYNVHQSKIAIGSGGFFGKGYLKGTQTKYNFVPEQDTDFIFCTVGEEWGFLGTLSVLAIFLFLILRIIYLAEKQRSTFSRVYGYSVSAILFFHFSVNIAMTIGLAPVIGIPLPFFSYGGSSLWAFTILLFIFLKLDTGREETL